MPTVDLVTLAQVLALDGTEFDVPLATVAEVVAAEASARGYTDTQLAALVGDAPGALDTLTELAEALGDDDDFAATVTTALAARLTQTQADARYRLLTALIALDQLDVDGVADGQLLTVQGGEVITADPPANSGTSVPESWGRHGFALIGGVQTAGTWVTEYDAGHEQVANDSSSDGDQLDIPGISLAAGTYSLAVSVEEQSGGGILDVDLDGTEIASIDTYAASKSLGVTSITTGITVAEDGAFPLTLRVDGQNASSSNFRANIHAVAIWRTGT